jgi:uncharacterized RDD family membrane protein YckC
MRDPGSTAMPQAGVSANYASPWIRFVALLIDGVILGLVIGLILTLILGQAVAGLVNLVIGAAYFTYCFSMWNGQTIGARAMNIRVVDANGGLLSPTNAFLRWVAANFSSIAFAIGFATEAGAIQAIAGILGIVQLIGYLMAFWDARRQTLQDKAAGSFVVTAR